MLKIEKRYRAAVPKPKMPPDYDSVLSGKKDKR